MKYIASILVLTIGFSSMFLARPAAAQTGVAVPTMAQCDTLVQNFVTTWGVEGMTLAISYQGRLIYSRGFGYRDAAHTKPMQHNSVLRVASISKSIASTGLMKLVEEGKLSLTDKVFGPSGILWKDPYFAGANVIDPRYYDITVQHLLEHTGGWNELTPITPSPLPPYPWGFPYNDPGSIPLHVTMSLGEPNPITRRMMIKWRLQRMLDHAPGTTYNYSNTGFAMIAEIIEQVSGQSYQDFMQANIFDPQAIYDIKPGRSLQANLFERETDYHGTFTTLSATGNGNMVPWYYGGFWIEAMDGYGGMTATSSDLVRFLNGVDGFATRPDILSPTTLQTMTTASTVGSGYGLGWGVGSTGWWHNGQFDGTASIYERRSSQVNFAMITNEVPAGNFRPAMNPLAIQCLNTATSIPTHDLFDVPSQQPTGITVTPSSATSLNVQFTPGNGTGRLVVMRKNAAPDRFPQDGTDYTASGSAHHDLGGGNYIVYSGSGNSVDVTGLDTESSYTFRVFEYNKTTTSGNNSLYQISRFAEGQGTTTTVPVQAATVSGRVLLQSGRAVANATVELRDNANNLIAKTRTTPFGFYSFDEVFVGQTYSLRANTKLGQFGTVPVTIGSTAVTLDIVETPSRGGK